VPDGALTEQLATAGDDIMRGPALGFVDDDHTIQRHASGIVYVQEESVNAHPVSSRERPLFA
jgi:hypothetical protein